MALLVLDVAVVLIEFVLQYLYCLKPDVLRKEDGLHIRYSSDYRGEFGSCIFEVDVP